MRALGVSEAEVSGVTRALLAVLHLGNVAFAAPPGNSEGSEAVGQGASGASLAHACRLLGVEPAGLGGALCWQTRRMPGRDGGVISSPLPVAKASDSRDALARHLYGAIFGFLVRRLNEAVGAEKSAPGGAGGLESCRSSFIGLLDIFGFEHFETNSFEQLCINFTNELLQQYFNEVIFDHEAELYSREGIPWDPLDFPDNTMSVELIGSAKDGLLTMLDQECQTVAGNAEQWCRKLQGAHSTSKLFGVVRQRPGNFVVEHFAGPVEYTSQTFLEKNRDELSADLVRCVKEGSDEFMRHRFLEHDRLFGTQESVSVQTGSRRVVAAKKYSVSGEFRGQLRALMQRIRTTEPHFVRCIKPNPENRAGVFHRSSVVQQLRYQGVLQAIEVSRAGYPMRLNHREGVLDFRSLARREDKAQLEAQALWGRFRTAAQVLFQGLSQTLPSGSWALGGTLLFLKSERA
ncbi:unnamed protein product [Prorocentrum cordatum]|uniref:Myosin motor domain-containing protein n=1 Tax=Prorocentrum cordatum TaxID=2364126 RepID=A0ABN9U4S1_9DINO|nr:unnamed protein product [Polarella glacialis]